MIDKDLKNLCLDLMKNQSFDTLAVGLLNFVDYSFKSLEITKKNQIEPSPRLYFDLASITKPLTLALSYLEDPKSFSDEMLLLLEHRAGLPAWGRLSKDSWREELLKFKIQESETLYSDYSALRLMFEIEKKRGKSIKEICAPYFDSQLKHWKELSIDDLCVVTGFRRGGVIQGQVHDDNAYTLNEFLSHAGLFATIEGISKTLFNIEKKLGMIEMIDKLFSTRQGRFLRGFDTVEDLEKTLAGKGCSPHTFGHLGFTGTSFWIDCKTKKGIVILSNGTQNFWYARERLNHLRREIGTYAWK